MNQEQYERACAVVDKDATGKGALFDTSTGEYCALGGLLSAAGVPDDQLLVSTDYDRFLPVLLETYGISTHFQVSDIWHTNDRFMAGQLAARRIALKELFLFYLREDEELRRAG